MFSSGEVAALREHPCIQTCSAKSITYTYEFKRQVLTHYDEGVSPREIWRRAGLDIRRPEYPRECVKRWRKIVQQKGFIGLETESGARSPGRPKTKGVTDADTIKRLKLEVAYLKAENDFLATLRATRAESNSGQRKHTRSSDN